MTGAAVLRRVAVLLIAALAVLRADEVAAEPYLLGPEDVISLRAVAWDDESASYMSMESMAGEYAVSSEGKIMIPLVGEVAVAGKSLSGLGADLSATLQQVTGLYQPPKVALQIAAYRPFYVGGIVSNPGSYAWRPGLTASKALAIAGGLLRDKPGAGSESAVFRDTSSLRGTQVELARLRARQARLLAELQDGGEISFPQALHHPDGAEAVARIFGEEQAIFAIRREAAERDVDSNEELISLHQTELTSLEAKLEGHSRRLQLVTQQVENLRTLADRGDIVTSRLVSAENMLAELSAEELDLETASFRARQRISETERDLLQYKDNREQQVIEQLQETRRRLELETTRETMFMSLAAIGGAPSMDGPVDARMQVRRDGEHGVEVIAIGPDDAILPGDVFEVFIDFSIDSQ